MDGGEVPLETYPIRALRTHQYLYIKNFELTAGQQENQARTTLHLRNMPIKFIAAMLILMPAQQKHSSLPKR
ncbi:hypothetical protein J4727_14210 [Providencia rettgeri]|uniref:Uncharacterized protein n=1 Tax=Providencia rettgeri TaxID=587 RepID=A0A939NGN2_PRORE|nr:hypothetical protein [Providencia rettgeri]